MNIEYNETILEETFSNEIEERVNFESKRVEKLGNDPALLFPRILREHERFRQLCIRKFNNYKRILAMQVENKFRHNDASPVVPPLKLLIMSNDALLRAFNDKGP